MKINWKALLQQEKAHAMGNGVYLRARSGNGLFLFRSKLMSTATVSLGSLDLGAPDASYDKAQLAAAQCRAWLAEGKDPARELRVKRVVAKDPTALTIDGFYKKLVAQQDWDGDRTKGDWDRLWAHLPADFRAMQPDAITTEDVLAALLQDPPLPKDTQYRLRQNLCRVLESSRHMPGGLRERDANPADNSRLKEKLPKRGRGHNHHAALSFELAHRFRAEMAEMDHMAAPPLAMVTASGVREAVSVLAQWGEFDFQAQAWAVPGETEKSGEALRVPFNEWMIDVLHTQFEKHVAAYGRPPLPTEYVFPGKDGASAPMNGSTVRKLMAKWCKAAGVDATVHGLRSTMRDWAGEVGMVREDIAEAMLSHHQQGTRGAYQRGDLFEARRGAASAWDQYTRQPPPKVELGTLNPALTAKADALAALFTGPARKAA